MNVRHVASSSYPAVVPTSIGTQVQTSRHALPVFLPRPADEIIDVIEIRANDDPPAAARRTLYPPRPGPVEKGTLIDVWI